MMTGFVKMPDIKMSASEIARHVEYMTHSHSHFEFCTALSQCQCFDRILYGILCRLPTADTVADSVLILMQKHSQTSSTASYHHNIKYHNTFTMKLATLLLACFFSRANGFAGLHVHDLHDTAVLLKHSGAALVSNAASAYSNTLHQHPIFTKMITGGTMATTGDAIAQSQTDDPYNKRRALSFMSFDMCYRALQHVAFPIIVLECHGQYLSGLLSSAHLADSVPTEYLAAMEQTLASQLCIVPLVYYPVFYALTAFVQNLSTEAAIDRAKATFLPLMSKNLKFWIPVQFIQFGFIDEQLQIPFLSAAGLCWTFILSVAAGSTKDYNKDEPVVNLVELTAEDTEDMEEAIAQATVPSYRSLPDQQRNTARTNPL
jgi:hypothetical protein